MMMISEAKGPTPEPIIYIYMIKEKETNMSTIRIQMTEAEVGAVKDLISFLETCKLKHEEKKTLTRIMQFVNSIHGMRTGERLSGYKLTYIEREYNVANRDISYVFEFEKEKDNVSST
jgi:hypothetical protein